MLKTKWSLSAGEVNESGVPVMMKDLEPYQPIDCGVHDELLARATLARPTELVYVDEKGVEQRVHDRIVDVFARDRAEYLRLASGLEIRLDKLVAIDGQDVTAQP
ncbi:MAG TPA: hypothetical protein VK101_03580 [Limnochordia bacterium]|nr:hypothetical protein [Limnochordia bacterium]